MIFRKINYISDIYNFFNFTYSLGYVSNLKKKLFVKNSKIFIYFPMFTSLGRLEGRPIYLKKKPFVNYLFVYFNVLNSRSTFMPFFYSRRVDYFFPFIKLSNLSNFYFAINFRKLSSFVKLFCFKNSKNKMFVLFFYLRFIVIYFNFNFCKYVFFFGKKKNFNFMFNYNSTVFFIYNKLFLTN